MCYTQYTMKNFTVLTNSDFTINFEKKVAEERQTT